MNNRSLRLQYLPFLTLLVLFSCKKQVNISVDTDQPTFYLSNPQAYTLNGERLLSPEPSEKLAARWKEKYTAFQDDSTNIDNIIWHGRFTAYMGDYLEAIEIYSDGINLHPEDPRLYRHRGHRYITIRKFDAAIEDYRKAVQLIQGQPNQVEPDGMPNAQNIPVSTLHGNIYYHLGLAYYLKGDLENALSAYQSCLATSERPDNVVSASHWLYMILRQLGRDDEAKKIVENIDEEMEIIENMSYHKLCLLYNGSVGIEEFINSEDQSANDAELYGIANWYYYNGDSEKGEALMKELVAKDSWNSFGYIAAEAFLSR